MNSPLSKSSIYSALAISALTNLSYATSLTSSLSREDRNALIETAPVTNFVTIPMKGNKMTIPREIFPKLAIGQNFMIAQEYQCTLGRIKSIEWKIIGQDSQLRRQALSLLAIPYNNLEVSCVYIFSTGKELHLFATSQTDKMAKKEDIAICINFVSLKSLSLLKATIK